MIEIQIPGREVLRLSYLVSDYNGTLACDGKLIPGVAVLLKDLSTDLQVHVVTADTFGLAQQQLKGLPVKLKILGQDNQAQKKADYVAELGPQQTVALGNGCNDRLMLKTAVLGICVIESEGVCLQSLQAANVASRSAVAALELLLHPQRLVATLRT